MPDLRGHEPDPAAGDRALTGARLTGARLTGARLTGARLTGTVRRNRRGWTFVAGLVDTTSPRGWTACERSEDLAT
ncbi:MAG: pentapeptide repeat-containing protein [Ktedonobacterales bacterium]